MMDLGVIITDVAVNSNLNSGTGIWINTRTCGIINNEKSFQFPENIPKTAHLRDSLKHEYGLQKISCVFS